VLFNDIFSYNHDLFLNLFLPQKSQKLS